jgi:hypothetical protein
MSDTEPFDPTMALARFRELEALINLELVTNPEWQRMRTRGDTSFLLDSGHFAEQNRLTENIERHGYTIVDQYDEVTGDPIYSIEPLLPEPSDQGH